MKIAITGGTGFLGKYVVDRIKKENHIPVVVTRSMKGEANSACEYRICDYSKDDLKDKLSDIDAVVHLAATRGSQGNISEFHDNEILTQSLYDICVELNIKNIVYASTISVYSGEETLPWTEHELPAPKLMYGVSKMVCEHIGNIYSKNKGLHIKNLRFAHLYGFNEKNNYMINRFFRQAFHKEQLVLHAQSVAKREFLYGKDAAKAVLCALKQNELSGTFNIGSSEALTNHEVASYINNIFENTDNLLVKDPSASEGIQPSYMDNSHAKNCLGFEPDYTFSSALEEIYALMKELDDVPILY
ncbi:NAD-dependent epimerase/dehydratase family protein [Priestia megaterium]|uniref:NAD-dependent epimerase/dehydratase family protein n=1 Tax=Priestia megaterium TaxID=1404 RepID=UPI000BF7AE9A|nr:NAD(P)-dependent oxidoreductase [Priestia megaterium]PEW15573.1 UDP-N-acetylglucosamine 4-epimerase [Priestia megaterium]PFJ45110.1 UDP-N-acetylglucosamine 4-epimerase [Priestia megaterium]PGX78855.1 UDP-N-acetylglucosamine 4-epimerase [Priestia megaterium]